MPKDNEPSAPEGNTTQLSGDEREISGVPPSEVERVEDSFEVLPPSTTENEIEVGENDNIFGADTMRVSCKVAGAYPSAVAVTVEL